MLTTLTLVEGGYAYAKAINDNGQVTGYGESAAFFDHAFLYDIESKDMTDLGTMGGYFSVGWGLNDLPR